MASKRIQIKLKSSKSSHVRMSQKNTVKTPHRLEIKKFDPLIREHCMYKESK